MAMPMNTLTRMGKGQLPDSGETKKTVEAARVDYDRIYGAIQAPSPSVSCVTTLVPYSTWITVVDYVFTPTFTYDPVSGALTTIMTWTKVERQVEITNYISTVTCNGVSDSIAGLINQGTPVGYTGESSTSVVTEAKVVTNNVEIGGAYFNPTNEESESDEGGSLALTLESAANLEGFGFSDTVNYVRNQVTNDLKSALENSRQEVKAKEERIKTVTFDLDLISKDGIKFLQDFISQIDSSGTFVQGAVVEINKMVLIQELMNNAWLRSQWGSNGAGQPDYGMLILGALLDKSLGETVFFFMNDTDLNMPGRASIRSRQRD